MKIILKPHQRCLLTALLVFLSSCATVGVKEITPEEVSEIESRVAANSYYPALKLSGRISIKDFLNGKGWSATGASIAVLRPYSLRASFHSRAGWSWFFAVSNPDEIGVSIPPRGISEVWARKGDGSSGILKIGSLEISVDDFIRFIHPGLDRGWVRDGGGRLAGEKLTVTYPGVEYIIGFDSQKRMETVEIKREKSKKITVRYSRLRGDDTNLQSFGVEFGNLMKFDLTKIVRLDSLPPSLFEVPAGLR